MKNSHLPPLFQAASALHEMYKKFPVLYNTSLVSSFEPKVIYKVRRSLNSRKQTTFWVRSENSHRPGVCLRTDASDRPSGGHGPRAPALETEPLERRHSSQPVHLGSDVDGGPGRLAGLGPPPHTVETLRRLGHLCAEGLHLAVGGANRRSLAVNRFRY